MRAGELVALIGANGAGKSTLLRAIAGLLPPAGGPRGASTGRDVTGQPPEAILRAGIALVPERRRVFADLTVLDNLELGGYALPARRAASARGSRRRGGGLPAVPGAARAAASSSRARCRAASSRCSPSAAR